MGILTAVVVGMACFALGFYAGIKAVCAWHSRQLKTTFPDVF